MELEDVLLQRWSCRAFAPDPVPRGVQDRLFALAQRTASWCNTQPWQVHVTEPAATRRFTRGLRRHVETHDQVSDLPMPVGYHGVYQARRREAGYGLYDSVGIERSDRPARSAQMLRNFDCFGAPHVAIVSTDRDQGVYGAVDCGGYVANLLNVAHSLGVATVPQAAIAQFSDHVREFFALTDDRLVVCAVSFGYPDTSPQ